MKILLFGAMGQLGTELHRTLSPFGEVAGYDIHNLNLENTDQVRETIQHNLYRMLVRRRGVFR